MAAAFSVVSFVCSGSAYGTERLRPMATRCSCSRQYDFLLVVNGVAMGVLYDGSDKVVQ